MLAFLLWSTWLTDAYSFYWLLIVLYLCSELATSDQFFSWYVSSTSEEKEVLESLMNAPLSPPVRFEDKYLEEIRAMVPKDWEFSQEELDADQAEVECQLEAYIQYAKKPKEESDGSTEFVNVEEEETEEIDPEVIEQKRKEYAETARTNRIKKHLDRIVDCFVLEKTPLGNVLMRFNRDAMQFHYFSDHSIPYRFLETVARKFVKTFQCRPIYVDMEEELKRFEEKWEQQQKEKQEQEEKEQAEAALATSNTKKDVFAKFKGYNKEGPSGRVNTAAPPKNNIANVKNKEVAKVLLKERANWYKHEGKLANFSFLKKVPRKQVDKVYALTFAEYKRLQEMKR